LSDNILAEIEDYLHAQDLVGVRAAVKKDRRFIFLQLNVIRYLKKIYGDGIPVGIADGIEGADSRMTAG